MKDKSRVFFFTTRTENSLYDTQFKKGDYLVFGKEAEGLSEHIIRAHEAQLLTIPFPGKVRSFNLANAVAMVLGEGMRQMR